MNSKEVFDSYVYPEDGEYVIYYFEPFERWYTGFFEYNGADNGVSGKVDLVHGTPKSKCG